MGHIDAKGNPVGDTVADASAISFTPTGTIASTDVQSAISEVATEATDVAAKSLAFWMGDGG